LQNLNFLIFRYEQPLWLLAPDAKERSYATGDVTMCRPTTIFWDCLYIHQKCT